MNTYTVVRPEHLNHAGYLFGGQMLRWVDEYAWLAATRDFPVCRFVTRAMNKVDFRRQVPTGAILRFACRRHAAGTTSVVYRVVVHATPPGGGKSEIVFKTQIVFVNLDEAGQKTPLATWQPT